MTKRSLICLMILAALFSVVMLTGEGTAQHSGGIVTLTDANNAYIKTGTNIPYSPKLTCTPSPAGTCHKGYATVFNLTSVYESDIAFATKDHGPGTPSYQVPYPKHGVTAGYHQMGRNVGWGAVQRDFYKLFAFTSSPGMYGKYCPPSNRQLAHPVEADATRFDMSSYDFAHSECAWCHPGGASLEYDRAGYRYDGAFTGLLGTTGFNGNRDAQKGDYYTYVAGQGLVSRSDAWSSGGVVEFDCLMCHYSRQYANLERNWGVTERPAAGDAHSRPRLAASLGLVGAKGQRTLLNIGQKGALNINPDIDQAKWSWGSEVTDILSFARLSAAGVVKTPLTENCALCHFEDAAWTAPGPAGEKLGATVFQRFMPPGSVADLDETGLQGTDRKNDTAWTYAKKRAEYGKRIGAINDPLQNPDVHMDRGMNCVDCHYMINKSFSALQNDSGTEILPAVDIYIIDHMFAKGNNSPDGRNMDQIANTVTCESCHITGAHERVDKSRSDGLWYLSGTNRIIKVPSHPGFPSFHFNVLDCRTCHIPELKADVKENVIDHTAGPYRGYERSQASTGGGAGIVYRPFYLSRMREKGKITIQPTITMTSAVWVDGTEDRPTFQRFTTEAAEAYREFQGDKDSNGVYDWPLNRAQNGDTALIVNRTEEISWMVNKLRTLGVAEPVMNLYVNAFTVSHNTAPPGTGKILGSPEGGVCLMCHSTRDENSYKYSPYSVGFFDKKNVLFDQPKDGGKGLVQTVLNDASGNPVKRVQMRFKSADMRGTPFTIDIAGSAAHEETVPDALDQRKAFGFSDTYVEQLIDPATGGVETPIAYFTVKSDAVVSRKVLFDASSSICKPANATCTYTWDFGGAGAAVIADPVKPSFTYNAAGTYTVRLKVSNGGTQGIRTQSATAVDINNKPVASYVVDGSSTGRRVVLKDTSTDPDGDALTVRVTWGDGRESTGPGGATLENTYRLNGTYKIFYRVTDSKGASSLLSFSLKVPL